MTDLLTANDGLGELPRTWYREGLDPFGTLESLNGAHTADVCVIGGGFTGLSTALHLAEAGYDVVLLEANRIAGGASGRNGGQVGTGQRRDQLELEAMVGADHARRLWELSLQSVDLVRVLAGRAGVPMGEGIIEACHREREVGEAHHYVRHLQTRYGYDKAEVLDCAALRDRVGSMAYYGGALDHGSAHINPYAYAVGLAKLAHGAGARMYERSRVRGITRGATHLISTDRGHVRAKFCVLACNGYLGDLVPEVAQRVMPINNFIAVTEPLDQAMQDSLITGGHAVADSKFVVNYFRLDQDRMVFGGSESYGYRFPSDIAAKVRKPMLEIFPQLAEAKLTHAWGGTLGITMNRMPHFARIEGNMLSASGYSGHGVAMATFAGQLLAEAIGGQAERFDVMANVPTQRFPGGTALRWPLLVLAMAWYSLRDRL